MRTLFVAVGMLLAVAGWGAALTIPAGDAAALVAAVEKSQPGDEIRLAAGTYRLPATLALHTGTKLLGAGREQTILQPGGEKARVLIGLNGVQDVTLADLALDGAPDPLAVRGISGYNSQRLTLIRLVIRNLGAPGAIGIHFNGKAPTRESGVLDSLIADCVIENIVPDNGWGAGVRFSWGSSRNTIRNCRIDNTGRGGIFGDNGSNDLIIRENIVTRSHGEKLGIEVWGGCNRCVIEDNTIDHWLSIGGCDWCAVRRNKIACAEKDCSAGFGLEAIGSNLVFTGNVVDGGQTLGLSVSGNCRKQYHYYGDNTFRRCTQWAAQLQGEGAGFQNAYFYRCRFNDTTFGEGNLWYPGYEGHGFRINGDTQHLVAEECDMRGNARLGLQLGGARVDALDFRRCTVRDNKGAAVEGPQAYTALEWTACDVAANGSNRLPEAKPFPAPPPVARFKVVGAATAGAKVRFVSDSATGKHYLWDLGDGPALAGDEVRWTYTRPGKYTVTQIVWDAAGRASRAEQVVEVK